MLSFNSPKLIRGLDALTVLLPSLPSSFFLLPRAPVDAMSRPRRMPWLAAARRVVASEAACARVLVFAATAGAAEFCGERGAVPLLCPPPSAVAERRGVARAAEGHVAAEEREARRRKWVARRRRGIWWPRAPALTRGAPIELPCSGTRRIEVTARVLDSASSRAAWTALLPSPSSRLARRRRKPGRSGGAPARAPASRGGARWGGGRSAPSTSLAAAAGTPGARRSLRSVGTTRGSRAPCHISSSSSSSTSARFGAWRPIRNDCVPVAVPCCEGFLHQRVRYPQIQFGSRSLVSISASGPMRLLFFYFFPFFSPRIHFHAPVPRRFLARDASTQVTTYFHLRSWLCCHFLFLFRFSLFYLLLLSCVEVLLITIFIKLLC